MARETPLLISNAHSRASRVLAPKPSIIYQSILDKVVSIQKLPDEDKNHIMYSIDGLIQHAKTRLAYK